MGMSASQARFLQLTARKSNVEYQAQRINFERLQLADKSAAASSKYNDLLSNRKLTYTFNSGEGRSTVDLTYSNYKSYMNQQAKNLTTSSQKMFLVSSSGNKIIVSNENEMKEIIENNLTTYTGNKETILKAKEEFAQAEAEGKSVSPRIAALAGINLEVDEDGNEVDKEYESELVQEFQPRDFMIVPDLDNVENFQRAIQEGIYFFATYGTPEGEKDAKFHTYGWDSLEGGSISEEYDKSDDAAAQAEYDKTQDKIQSMDKKLELQLNKLNTERDAIQTEMDSVKKVIEDNVESTFKVFS